MLGQQRESPIHSSPQINTSIEPSPVNTAHMEPVQSLPATSTSNNIEGNSMSPILQQQQSIPSAMPVQSSISSMENKMADVRTNDQAGEITSAQQQSVCPTPPLTQQPLISQSQSLECSQAESSVAQIGMEQPNGQILPTLQLNQSQVSQDGSVAPQHPQAISPSTVSMGQAQQMQMVSPQHTQPINQSQVTQAQAAVLGQSPQPGLQSPAQSQAQSNTSQTPQVNVLSQSNAVASPPLQPQIPDQSTEIQPSSQIPSQTGPQVQNQILNQSGQMQSHVPNQSSQVQSSNEAPLQLPEIQPTQVPIQSTQVQSQIPDQSTQIQSQIPNQSSPVQSQATPAAQIQIPASTASPPLISGAALLPPQQVPDVGQTPGGPIPTHNVPAVTVSDSQTTIPPGQTAFGEYTNVSKTNDSGIGSQQTPQLYPPSDTNAVVNSTGITNISYMSPTSTPTSITPGFTNPLAPVTHHQERAALQQQLQELYCIPPAPEVQEKIVALQEKLQALQQHEANEQCNGGAQCILQTPLFTAPVVVDSPQVSSTTGRGRSKGTSRAKKSRKKADKEAAAPITAQPTEPIEQPVSENLVTPGDSSNIVDSAADSVEDMKPTSGGDVEEEWPMKGKKARPPRKPRKPKEPKEPKEPKPKKEKEPKQPKEPKTPKEPKPKKKKDGKETTPKRNRK